MSEELLKGLEKIEEALKTRQKRRMLNLKLSAKYQPIPKPLSTTWD